jgi:hypothetical protein
LSSLIHHQLLNLHLKVHVRVTASDEAKKLRS